MGSWSGASSRIRLWKGLLDGATRREVERLLRNRRAKLHPIYVDYPPHPSPRYGWGKPPHPALYNLINERRQDYIALIHRFRAFKDGLRTIPTEKPQDSATPYWTNGFLGGLNAVALYCLPKLLASSRYIEVGSGNSTKFVRKGITDNGLATKIVSIDPSPRAEIDGLCDRVIRSPLEQVDRSVFDELAAGDILMVDNSHRCFQNSDVTVVFLEILPHLRPGVVVYIDDVYLPYDYPPEWAQRYYSEQYLLAVLLLAAGPDKYEVTLPHVFIDLDPELKAVETAFLKDIGHPRSSGNGIWLTVR